MNFSKNLQDATEEDLLLWMNNAVPGYANLASDELTRRRLSHLKESIDNGTQQAEKSSEANDHVSKAMLVLAAGQVILAICQLIISFAYSENPQEKIFGIVMSLLIFGFFVFFAWHLFRLKINK